MGVGCGAEAQRNRHRCIARYTWIDKKRGSEGETGKETEEGWKTTYKYTVPLSYSDLSTCIS